MKYQKVLGVLAVGIMVACQPPSTPTQVNVYNQNTQNQGSNQNGSSGGGSTCAGLAGSVSLDTTGGTASGGHPRVGEVWFLALNVSVVGGGQLPPACLSAAPEVSAVGPCRTDGFAQSLGKIQVLPTAVGLCTITARFDGKVDSLSADVIE